MNISAFQTDEKCEYLVEGESEESEKDSEEDSNAEDYWGNEYPDEEDLEGVDYSSEEEDFNEDRQDFLSLTSRYRNAHSEFLQQMKNLDVGGNNEEEDDDDSDLVSE